MEVNLSNSTLVCCRCALMSHLKDLRSMVESASTVDFRSFCEAEVDLYNTALAEINKIFNS